MKIHPFIILFSMISHYEKSICNIESALGLIREFSVWITMSIESIIEVLVSTIIVHIKSFKLHWAFKIRHRKIIQGLRHTKEFSRTTSYSQIPWPEWPEPIYGFQWQFSFFSNRSRLEPKFQKHMGWVFKKSVRQKSNFRSWFMTWKSKISKNFNNF